MKKTIAIFILFTSLTHLAMAQDKGVLSGNFQTNFSVFLKDSLIQATEQASPQYGRQISSSEAWLFLNYDIKGFHVAARYDLFNNSNLLNPSGSFSDHGLGFWQIKKDIANLELTVGSFYDQFGSGAIFRSFENRLIGIDYAMEGVRAKYKISDNFNVKAFTGRQKGTVNLQSRFETHKQIIKGINIEKGFNLSDNANLVLGASGVNRTLDEDAMNTLVTEINSLPLQERYYPKYNVYAVNGYWALSWKNFGFTGEYNKKTDEAIRVMDGTYRLHDGSLFLTGINYSKRKIGKDKKGGFGVNFQYRRIENFPMVVSPFSILLDGIFSYQPSFSRQASYRMLARYQAPGQALGEQAYQGELIYSPNKKTSFQVNYADIKNLDGVQLFNERYVHVTQKVSRHLKGKIGLQSVTYNQDIYETKPGAEIVETLTPFFDITYKINRKNSLRFETQFLTTQQDLGSFYHGIVEWNRSPNITVAISDMVNTDPVRKVNPTLANQVLHYPSLFFKYNIKTTSITAAYVKQVEGVNCTGGICRLEPAFSGLRFTLATQF